MVTCQSHNLKIVGSIPISDIIGFYLQDCRKNY